MKPIDLRRLFYPSIHTRTTVPFFIVVLIVAAISVYTVTRLVAGSIQERFDNQLADSASAASNAIVAVERQQLATLRQMVFTEGVPQAVAAQNSAELDAALRPIMVNEGVHDVMVFDVRGQVFFRLVEDEGDYNREDGLNLNGWESVGRVITGEADTLGDKYIDIAGEPPLFYISAPVLDENRVLVGGITIGMRLDTLAARVREQSLSGVIFHTSEGELLATTLSAAQPEAVRLSPAQLRRLNEEVQRHSPIQEHEFEGRPYQVLYAPFQIRSEQIGVMGVGLPSNFIVEQSSISRNTLGGLFSVMAGLVIALGLVTARTITRPVDRLVKTTRAIREGDLSRRVNLKIPDELGELAVSFDHMTDQLVERNKEINLLYLQQLQETARRQAVLASISDAVIVLDHDGAVFFQNAAALALLEASARLPDTGRAIAAILAHPAEHTSAILFEVGDTYYSSAVQSVLLDSGESIGYVVVFRDISAVIQSEKLKDELLLQMSHELRTPMTAVLGYVDLVKMLDSANLSDQSLEFLDQARDGLHTLNRMVNQVVDVSAIIADRLALSFQTVDLIPLLENLIRQWQPHFERRDIRFWYRLAASEVRVVGDETYLQQAIEHVLRNAYSYTLPGGWAELQIQQTPHHVHISVMDGGVGIHPDEQERVFERMYRGRSADAGPTDARGLGLGLYIARYIMERHGGSITLTSQPEVGTSVMVTLPLPPERG